MSSKERVRLDVMHRIERGEVTVVSAAVLMGISLRQARRLWKRYGIQGAAGLIHRSRGQANNRRLEEGLRERIVKRYQERYADFGPTLACEKLAEDGLVISAAALVPDTLWHNAYLLLRFKMRKFAGANYWGGGFYMRLPCRQGRPTIRQGGKIPTIVVM